MGLFGVCACENSPAPFSPVERWNERVLGGLHEAFKIRPSPTESQSEASTHSFHQRIPELVLPTEGDLSGKLEDFVAEVKSLATPLDHGALRDLIPLDALLCLALKRLAQPMSQVWLSAFGPAPHGRGLVSFG